VIPGLQETSDPQQGVFPDSRRLLRKWLNYDPQDKLLKVRCKGRRGFMRVDENQLPENIVKKYKLDRKQEKSR
jgi:hypothetical protein